MPLKIIEADITELKCDAIVNAANSSLLGGGGVDGAIHRAAGPELLEECIMLNGCDTGDAKVTKGYHLPAKYVIHTVGPIYEDGKHGEEELLVSCYKKSLTLATENDCKSVAFPIVSGGIYGYPPAEALKVAVETIKEYIAEKDIEAYVVVFDRRYVELAREMYPELIKEQ